MEQEVRISAHHGDVERPNQLKAAKRVLRQNPEIQCLEIDFVSFQGEIVSSHDYALEMIQKGAPLREWMLLCARRQCVLWIDVKQNEWFYFNGMYGQFDVDLFFETLKLARREIARDMGIDMRKWLWIGCQNCALRDALHHKNKRAKHGWHMVLDMPFVKSYVYKALLPSCMPRTLARLAEEEILNSDYEKYAVLSLDQVFFATHDMMLEFLRELRLPRHTTVILNSFSRDVEPLRVRGLNIVMQYDYVGQ